MKTKIIAVFFALAGAVIAGSLDQGAYNVSASAGSVIKAYEENEVKADLQYGGRVLSVGGKSGKVGKEFDGDPFLELFASDSQSQYGPHLHCRFREAWSARIATIRPGSLIGVKGIIVGRRNGQIILKDCSL